MLGISLRLLNAKLSHLWGKDTTAFMKPEEREVKRIFAAIHRRYDAANLVLSFGLSALWRRRLIGVINKTLPESGQGIILDLCTGSGALLSALAPRFKQVVGVDFCLPMLEKAMQRLPLKAGLVAGDGLRLPFAAESFDAVSVAFGLRNFQDLECGLSESARVLKKGGRIFILEFSEPRNPVWRGVFGLYSRYLMPLIGGLITGQSGAYRYLQASLQSFCGGEVFLEAMRRASFYNAAFCLLPGGVAYLYSGTKAG